MRRLGGFALVLSVFVGLIGVDPADSTSVAVDTEAEYRAALTTLSGDTSGPHTITLGADITITGGTDPTYTGTQPLTIEGGGFTLSGGDTRRVLLNDTQDVVLTIGALTVRDGLASGSGGAIRWHGDVVATDVEFQDNTATGPGNQFGGALFARAVTLVDASFTGNEAISSGGNASGGAIYVNDSHALDATRTVFEGNTADAFANATGGAVHSNGALDLTDSVVRSNTAVGNFASAGGVRPADPSTMTRTWFFRNSAQGDTGAEGGAIGAFPDGSLITLVDTTIEQNELSTSGDGAGAAVFASALDVSDVTIADNTILAVGQGEGAVHVFEDLTGRHATVVGNQAVTVSSLVVKGNLSVTGFAVGDTGVGSPNCEIGTPDATHSVDDDGTCGFGAGAGNASGVDDLLVGAVRDNGGAPYLPGAEAATDAFPMRTVLPLAGSPLIGRVPSGATCPDTLDQRGVSRTGGGTCDTGAIDAVFPPHAFVDVPAWVEDAVRWLASDVFDPRLITGITPTTFVPNDPITRAQVVRMLYREEGSPDVDGYDPHPFVDVPAWVQDAVTWAYGEEIVTGITPTTFAPNDPISRAQVVRMKYRFAGSPDVSGVDPHPFVDVPAWVQDPVTWAANPDLPLPLVTGITPTTFKPNDPITRAQVARMDHRLAITPAAWADPNGAPRTMPFRSDLAPS